MMSSGEGFRARRRRKQAASPRASAKRSDARGARLKRHRGQLQELRLWSKDVGQESRRRARRGLQAGRRRAAPLTARAANAARPAGSAALALLRPIGLAVHAVLAPVAPWVSRGLLLVFRAGFGLVAGLLDLTLAAGGWIRVRVVPIGSAAGRWIGAHVTPARTFAAVAAVAAVAIAVAQFIDYRATAIGGAQYSGEVGTVAPVPRIDQKPTGDPHLYVMLPLALAALPLIWLALGGRSRLARAAAAIGAVGVLVSLAVDLPQGLDTGRAGDAYEGTEAHLIEGFWTQLIASAALLVSGLALATAARREVARGDPGPRPDELSSTPTAHGRAPSQAAGSGAGA